MAGKKNSRLKAAEIICRWLEDQSFPERKLAEVEYDPAFIHEVVNGVVRNRCILQWLENRWLQEKPRPFCRAVLWIGLYQLLFMDRIEPYAAVNETVNAAKVRPEGAGVSGMINAVLRRACRERESVLKALEKQPAYVRHSHPRFLMDRWMKQYGQSAALELAAWNNEPPFTVLRIEQAGIGTAEFMEKLRKAGIEARRHPYVSQEIFLVLPRGTAVRSVPGYQEGWFTVQDPATSLSIDLLVPQPGEIVLDACAAPGGKTAMIAGRMKRQGKLIAMELHKDRLEILRENRRRLGLEWLKIVKGDARRPSAVLGGRDFDAILLDVPCLNSGVLRRRADARWRINACRLRTLVELQAKILDACAALLKRKGRLVYSTCSLEPEENGELIARWVSENPGFRLVKTAKTFPPDSGTDGAFAALLRRK